MTSKYKLRVSFIPTEVGRLNSRQIVNASYAGSVEISILPTGECLCDTCGTTTDTPILHTDWEFDEVTKVQQFTRFLSLCEDCSNVRNIKQSMELHKQGKLDITQVIAHFTKVNKCSFDNYLEHLEYEHILNEVRSRVDWEIMM